MNKTLISLASAALMIGGVANAVVIDNDIAAGTVGHLEIDVDDAGDTRTGTITASGAVSGTLTTEVIFDYFSYVDVGAGGFRLGSTVTSSASSSGDDSVTSSGAFFGSAGNTIDWSVTSTIADLDDTMVSTFTFTAASGTLGDLDFYQYLDEDVIGVSDDLFFTRGSVAGGDLELFTVDGGAVAELVGVSHGGAYSAAQGLAGADFAGWAACDFDDIRPAIVAGTQSVSLAGDICGDLSPTTIPAPIGGPGYGPDDIVSVLAWIVDPDGTTATIITTLGGVARAIDIPPGVMEPGMLLLFGAGLAGLGYARRRKA